MSNKLRVYLNEYNVLMDNAVYLPLVCGQLQAYAETKPFIKETYEFMPYIFLRDTPENILAQYDNPAVAGFSCSMWNINLNLAVAERVKARFPNCLIVFGGPQVPHDSLGAVVFLEKHSFVDVVVRGEGEHTFAELLEATVQRETLILFLLRNTPSLAIRSSLGALVTETRPYEEDLDVFPSPYLEGCFDHILHNEFWRYMEFQATVETNRGCPYRCSFCFWGQGRKYRFFSLDRVRQVAEWCGKNKIKYVFCADSNFGTFPRDVEIAEYFTEVKCKYGFPEKFRATFGKNTDAYQIGELLVAHNMDKGITLSTQSNDSKTLANVGRKNIKPSLYQSLREKYQKDNIPTYTELILGLPGETYDSFLKGMEEMLDSGEKNQVFVHVCQVYPNTEMGSGDYREKFGIETVRIPLAETHAAVHKGDITEYEEIVIGTATMPWGSWRRLLVISWIMQLLHGMKLGFHVLNYMVEQYGIKYIDFFEYVADLDCNESDTVLGKEVAKFRKIAYGVLDGKPRGVVMEDFGSIYWSPEEAAYLSIATQKDRFFEELLVTCGHFIHSPWVNRPVATGILRAIDYQKSRVPSLEAYESKAVFAREVVLRGRKSGRMLLEERK